MRNENADWSGLVSKRKRSPQSSPGKNTQKPAKRYKNDSPNQARYVPLSAHQEKIVGEKTSKTKASANIAEISKLQ